MDPNAQTNLGNVNSVRLGKLASGKDVVIRLHPKGVLNGYFHVESCAAQKLKDAGLPGYSTLAIHDFQGGDDFSFQVIEKLPGTAVKVWLERNSHDEATLLPVMGRMMARIHRIKVHGFGPFDNNRAKQGELVGLHTTFNASLRAALPFNLEVLVQEDLLSGQQAKAIDHIFNENIGYRLSTSPPVLVHNDYADWNLLTDGHDVTGILDLDECVGGDAVSDIACWSTFFDPERLDGFLKGYWQEAQKPDDFQDRFELLRLRYVVSKMTLRIRRYNWEPSEAIKQKIAIGKIHMAESMRFFGI
jgi:Ser/Thr protein kinase RdoA (MazF antagonist)